MSLPLRVQGLTVGTADGRTILTIEALSAEPGVCLGIRGPSGAGKSTLLFTLCGLLGQARGRISWGDRDILALDEPARAAFRRDHVGLIFQDFLLFEELGAAANAAIAGSYAPPRVRQAIREQAARTLRQLGLGDHGQRTVASFSGGERQRVAIARALANDPKVILADEPTANLDRPAADRLIDDLCRLAREGGKTLIAVSHDPVLHDRMDRVVDIVDGRLAADSASNV